MANNKGPNWGAALQAWGSGLGAIYSDNMRQEEERRKREQELADLNAANILAEQIRAERDGPVIPPPTSGITVGSLPGGGMVPNVAPQANFDYAGVSLPRAQFAGQRANPALDSWLQTHPITKQTNTSDYYMKVGDGYVGFSGSPWAAAGEGRRVNVVGTNNGLPVVELGNWSSPGSNDPMVPFTYPNADWVAPEVRGATINVPYPQYASLTNEFYGRFNEAGKSGSSPAQVAKAATQITNDLLGDPIKRLSKDGSLIDTRTGGTAVSGPDFNNLVSPELGRGVHQAVQDSLETGRWPLNSPADVLGANVMRDVGSQYIDMALPAGAQFNPGRANDPTDDEFTVPGGGRKGIPDNAPGWVPSRSNDRHMKTIDFFKEYIIPTINEAKDAGIGWQGLVKAAKTYGVNIDQLKGLLDQKKFAAYLATAAATPAAPKSVPRPKGF
jgi:hypothetical protein